jgi:hypothetical protein
MDINELQSYRLADAVKFNDQLNPRLWGSDEHLLPEVKEKLMAIADDFREFLGITDLEIRDITVSGSNAAYTYTPHSDIDLHLVVDLPKADLSDVYRELFDAKKYAYNDQHDYKIGGYDVELYVQNANEPHYSQGIYSLLNDEWKSVPKRRRPEIDDISVKSKYEDLGARIEAAVKSGDLSKMDAVAKKIKNLRGAGLEKTGEFGPENLAFKVLRNNGTLDQLRAARLRAKDAKMSLDERKKKKKSRKKYGSFGGMWFPGYHYYGDTGAAGDGGGDGGGESVKEAAEPQDIKDTIRTFVKFCAEQLALKQTPRIRLKRDPAWSQRNGTFGQYLPDDNTLILSVANRHPVDVLRTLAHELTHHRQEETVGIPDDAGATGSPFEDEANAMAGRIMRDFADRHPEFFHGQELTEVDTAQNPQPGDPIDWPEGTVHVKVSDVYDWYKLGQKLSNLDTAKKGEFGSGVPETILVFNNEPQEEHMIDQLEKLGLDVHDVDPGETPGQEVREDDEATVDYDIPYTLISRPENLWQMRRYGKISHYKTPRGGLAQISVPVSKERPFVAAMARQGVKVSKSQVYEASGYIPTEAERNDPRYSMALTQDIKPGQTGKEANKLGLQTDSQGRPALLMKKLGNLLESIKAGEETLTEDTDLFEVKMSPGELEKWAQSPEAEGIQAGFEAELIFRDAASGEESESEPDYDMDERAESIEEVVDFFRGGDYGISGGTANALRDALFEDYIDWREEQIYDAWEKEADEQVEEYMETQVWGDDEKRDEYLQQAAAELDIADMSEATPEQTQEIEQLAREKFAEDVQFQINEQGPYYDEARDDYRDHMAETDHFSEYEYFRDRAPYMSDVANEQSLDWPYWTEGSYNGGGRDVNEIADSLSEALDGAEVRGSTGYHSIRRRPGLWIIEPDGSLGPDDSDDAGLEVVSPPMPLPQALEALRKVIDWANSNDGDAYTNDSTGLHMGISVPFKGGNVDYIKLILFLGDQYVLDKFGRAANSYTRSALGKLQDVQRRRKELDEADTMTGVEKTAAAMDLMKKNLIELAAQYVQDGVGRDKYTSAHIKDGYIEFRSPGGDYLSMDSRDESELANTMLRFARAMQIASRPDLERKEYSKKLYKLLSGFRGAETTKTGKDTKYRTEIETYDDKDALSLFAKYSTGQITPEELKKAWARGVLAREQPRDRRGERWEIYDQGTGEVLDVVSGENEADLSLAIAHAMGKYTGRDVNIRKQGEKTEPSRRAKVAKKIIDRPTVWHIEDGTDGRVILIDAPDVATARDRARQRDPEFNLLIRMNPDQLIIKPATAAEVQQYQQQQQDQRQDSQQVQQRVQAPGGENRYRVIWTERRGGEQVADSLTVDARNADAAMDSVRSALNAQDRDVITIQAHLAGSTQDLQQQRAQQAASQPQGEFTGRWQVQDIQGRVLHTFGGIGNSQGDANRVARQWAEQNGFRQSFEVVPEMR